MATGDEQSLLRAQRLGRGLRCDPVGDLARDLVLSRGADGRLDLAQIEGVDNLAQALTVALTTPLGGDVFNVDFGFDGLNALTDESSPVLARERIRVSVVTLLRKDPRVTRVIDVKLVDQRLDTPGASAQRQLDVTVAFETLTGDSLTLTAGASGLRTTHG